MAVNTHGQVLPDLRMNIIDPRLARIQAAKPRASALMKEASQQVPDFTAISELLEDEDMFTVDYQSQVAKLNAIHQEFNEMGIMQDPTKLWGEQGRALINKVRRFQNDPVRMEMKEKYARALESRKKAVDANILNNPYVNNGIVEIDPQTGLPATVNKIFQLYDGLVGHRAEREFALNQGDSAKSEKALVDLFTKAGKSGETQFGGNAEVMETMSTLTDVAQLKTLLSTFITDDLQLVQANADINSIMSSVAQRNWDPQKTRAENQRTINTLTAAKIRALAYGTSDDVTRRSRKVNPTASSFNAALMNKDVPLNELEDIWTVRQNVEILKQGRRYTAPGSIVQGSAFARKTGQVDGDYSVSKNAYLQENGFFDNMRIVLAADLENASIDFQNPGEVRSFDNTVEDRAIQDLFVDNSLIDPTGKVLNMYGVTDANGNIITEGLPRDYGTRLAEITDKYITGPQQNQRPPQRKLFADALVALENDLSREMSGQNLKISRIQSIPMLVRMDANWWGLNKKQLGEMFHSQADDSNLLVPMSNYKHLFEAAGFEEKDGFGPNDDVMRINAVSVLNNNPHTEAYIGRQAGQPSYTPQQDVMRQAGFRRGYMDQTFGVTGTGKDASFDNIEQ